MSRNSLGPFRRPERIIRLINTLAAAMSRLENPALPAFVEDCDLDEVTRMLDSIKGGDECNPLLRPSSRRIEPVNDFQQAEGIASQGHPENGQVEPHQLIPGVRGMLVLDLEDRASLFPRVNQQRIGLTPATARLVLILDPRPFSKLEISIAKREKREPLFGFSLIAHPDCESAATF